LTNQYCWYHDNASPGVAERFLEAFDATVKKLGELPSLGRLRHFTSPRLAGIRSATVGGRFSVHLIFYRDHGDSLSVERVIHGTRDLERRLAEPPEQSADD
jgi:toxin ParE1/3/4